MTESIPHLAHIAACSSFSAGVRVWFLWSCAYLQPKASEFIYRKQAVKKLIKLKDILARIPVSRAHIYNLIAAGKFPSPTHLGGRGSFWLEEQIDEWIQGQVDRS
jgi:prophage regulatory protein